MITSKPYPQMDILQEVQSHYIMWKEDNDQRRTRKNGWNDVTDAYWGKLPDDWPYLSTVTDPRIRTSLVEKNARLLNAKLRGRLVPREGGDILKARINNALLDFQWDNANDGGTMLSKWAQGDMDTRLYGSKFMLAYWKHEENEDGKILFDGNECKPLDIRDCGIDPTSIHIRNARWFQHRQWMKFEDLEKGNKSKHGYEKYPGLKKLKQILQDNYVQDRRDTEYPDRLRTLKGLQDRIGEDKSFPVIEVVTEYRKDKFIKFAPKYNVILCEIDNPYIHGQIPIVQLRYYPLGDDPIGESEVEPVLGLWRAIQACVCGYLDEMAIKMRPPVKIVDGAARIETIIFGPEAQWIVDRPDAVTEYQSSGQQVQYFQTTYSALTSAFNTAMGDASQGVSNIDPFNPEKTATEIRQTAKQQNARDQSNQMYLSDAISDMMMMWLVNNKQFLFMDSEKKEYVLRILGSDMFNYFLRSGLDEMEVKPEAMQMIGDIISAQEGNVSDQDILELYESAKTPRYPIFDNPKEKDPSKLSYKPKMRLSDLGDAAELSIIPEDLDGTYDYIPDVRSMATGADQQLIQGRQQAMSLLTTNPLVLQLLQLEGVKPNVKEIMVSIFEDLGMKDAERYFTSEGPTQNGPTGGNGPTQSIPIQGVPNTAPTPSPTGQPTTMAGPTQVSQQRGILPSI